MAIANLEKKGGYYYTYDERLNKIAEKYDSFGDFKNVIGSTIIFKKNNYLYTYNKYFDKISEKYAG